MPVGMKVDWCAERSTHDRMQAMPMAWENKVTWSRRRPAGVQGKGWSMQGAKPGPQQFR